MPTEKNTCPKVGSDEGPASFQDINVTKFRGDWYLQWFTNLNPIDDLECMVQRYKFTEQKDELSSKVFFNNTENTDTNHVTKFNMKGDATGKFTVNGVERNFQIVDTNYFSYAIIYECDPDNELVSIYTRSADYPDKVLTKILATAKDKLRLEKEGSKLFGKDIDKFLVKMKAGKANCDYPVLDEN